MPPNDNLDLILRRHQEIGALLSARAGGNDYATLSRELAELDPVVAAIQTYRAKAREAADLAALIEDPATDSEMRAMAREELGAAEAQAADTQHQIRLALLPKDAADEGNVILEVRAGTGGDEAALFAGDLFRMYERYAALQGWKVELVSASEGAVGGYKEVIAAVRGKGAY